MAVRLKLIECPEPRAIVPEPFHGLAAVPIPDAVDSEGRALMRLERAALMVEMARIASDLAEGWERVALIDRILGGGVE